MKIEIQAGQAELLEKICAQAQTDGQPLSELELRCLRASFADVKHTGLKEIQREFPSPEAYDQFVSRAGKLLERTLVNEVEKSPQLTPEARGAIEKFLSSGGEAVVGSVVSMAMFGRVPAALRALLTLLAVLPLAAIFGWVLYSDLAGGKLPPSSRIPIEFIFALLVFIVLSTIVNLLKKVFAR
jgi:hypothetical protein